MSIEFYWIAVVATTIISASRITRLATVDKFPPAVWVREKWAALTVDTGWIWLFYCGYCFSFWATAGVITAGLFAGVYDAQAHMSYDNVGFTAWWIVNATFAASYVAAVFMAYDGDLNDDDEDED